MKFLSFLVLVALVSSVIADESPQPRRRNGEKLLRRRRPAVAPGSARGRTYEKFQTKKKKAENGDVVGFETEYKQEQDISYTVHGPNQNIDLSRMSKEDRSKHGCMTVMKRGNGKNSKKMTELSMEKACNMYVDWGMGMSKKPDVKLTDGQMKWIDSLSVDQKMKEMYARSHHGDAFAHGRTARQSGSGRAVRKEIRAMTDRERTDFFGAVNDLKSSFMDGVNKYDLFVNFHQANRAPGAHFGPGFLGYHRELLLRFENALREVNPTVSLPYWDSNLDNHLGDDLAQLSVLWTDTFMGNGKGDVTSGPFANWRNSIPINNRWMLHRNLTVAPPGAFSEPALMPDASVEFLNDATSLRELTWFVDVTYERHHGAVHNWVGGVMGDLPNSPNDPVFFLHHAFIDCLWEQMRARQRQRTPFVDPRFDYPNDTVALGVGIIQPNGEVLASARDSFHHSENLMMPFGPLRNIDGLRNEYFDEFYTCAPSPRCSRDTPDCGSQYLFCDRGTFRCAPKLNLGVDCSRFSGSDPCNSGECCSGTCRTTCDATAANNTQTVNPPDQLDETVEIRRQVPRPPARTPVNPRPTDPRLEETRNPRDPRVTRDSRFPPPDSDQFFSFSRPRSPFFGQFGSIFDRDGFSPAGRRDSFRNPQGFGSFEGGLFGNQFRPFR